MEPSEIVIRLRAHAHIAHAAAAWGFAGEGYVMEQAADLIEKEILNGNEEERNADSQPRAGKASPSVGQESLLEEGTEGSEKWHWVDSGVEE